MGIAGSRLSGAFKAGLFHSDLFKRDYPRIQILSVRDLLQGRRRPELPPFVLPAFQQAERVEKDESLQPDLFSRAAGGLG